MLNTFTEARAIPDLTPAIPGPLSVLTVEQLFGDFSAGGGQPKWVEHQFLPGQHIVTRGVKPNRIFVVASGIAVLDSTDEVSHEFAGRVVINSEIIGLVEMLAACPLNYDVTASTLCVVHSFSRVDVLEFLAARPEARSRVIHLLAGFIRDADRLLKRL